MTLNIGKGGIAIVKQVYRLAAFLPAEEKYGLRSQICRSAVLIPSNIAEGCSRSSQLDFKRFLEMALAASSRQQLKANSQQLNSQSAIWLLLRFFKNLHLEFR